jgi:hypothetical protein
MKYLITESQLDKAIFRYLDNQDFIQVKKGDYIYFVNSENDEFAPIRYDKDENWCNIDYELIQEIYDFFSLEFGYGEQVISKWVEDTLQMNVKRNSVYLSISTN